MKQQLFIDNVDGRTVQGHVLLSNYKPGEIEVILNTYIEVKGKVETEKINYASYLISKKELKSSNLKIPFSIHLDIDDYDTYVGKYISFNYVIEADIRLDSQKAKRCKQYILVNRDYSYKVEESQPAPYFTDKYISPWLYIFGFLFLSLSFIALPIFLSAITDAPPLISWLSNKSYQFLRYISQGAYFNILGLLILATIISFVSSRIVNKKNTQIGLNLDLRNDLDGFLVKFKYNRNVFELEDFSYEIYEVAIDDRGSITDVFTNELYKSKVISSKDKHTYKFPNLSGLKSMGTNASAIRWKISGTGVRKGLFSKKKRFSAIFNVYGEDIKNINILAKKQLNLKGGNKNIHLMHPYKSIG